MFIEDFTKGFSYDFTPIEKHDTFYGVSPADNTLKALLTFTNYSYFEYEFEELLSDIMYNLILNGKAYVEIVSWTDANGTVKGIEFIPVHAKFRCMRRRKVQFVAYDFNKEVVSFKIEKNRLLFFDLRDIGYKRSYFRKLIKHLCVFDATAASELVLDSNMNGIFDLTKYHEALEYKLLKQTKPVHWLGRSYSNKYLSESYLLYRTIQYKKLKYNFLEYILQQINEGLDAFKTGWDFSGKISIMSPLPDYQGEFEKYRNGEINASQLCKIVVENISIVIP